MDVVTAKQTVLDAESGKISKDDPKFLQAVQALMGAGELTFLAQHGGSTTQGPGGAASFSTPPATTSTPAASQPGGVTVGTQDPKVAAETASRQPAVTPPAATTPPATGGGGTTQPILGDPTVLAPPPNTPPVILGNDTSGKTGGRELPAGYQDKTSPVAPPPATGGSGDKRIDAVMSILGKVDKGSGGVFSPLINPVQQRLTDVTTNGVPTDPRKLGGSLDNFDSAYLDSAANNPGADDFLNNILMENGDVSGSQNLAYMSPIAHSVTGLINLANPGAPVSKQGQLQQADKLYSALSQGKGGQGMVDAGSLYDNLFSGGDANSMYQNGAVDASKQYDAVNSLLANLQSVIPPESFQQIQGMIDHAYLDYSHKVATGGGDAGANGGFLGYLDSIGARDWF